MSYQRLDILLEKTTYESRTRQRLNTEGFRYICESTYHFDELKQLYDGRVEKVVSGAIVQQGVDDRLKQVSFDDVAIIIFILQTDDSTHESQGTLERNKRLISCVAKMLYYFGKVWGNRAGNTACEQDLQRARKVCLEFMSTSTRLSRSLFMM